MVVAMVTDPWGSRGWKGPIQLLQLATEHLHQR
jgi:hypothetical protein